MSAINALRQRCAVHVMTDGLAYDADGTPVIVDLWKTHPIGALTACVSTTGPALLGEFLAEHLEERFDSFDALIAAGAVPFKELFFEHAAGWRDGDAVAHIVIAGWHEAAKRPALYSMVAGRAGPKWQSLGGTKAADLASGDAAEFFDLIEQEVLSVPTPRLELLKAAGYDITANLERVDPSVYLLHMLEIQRRIPFDGLHLVGGHALLTSIDQAGLSQRVVHEWIEDCEGEVVRPLPINWKKWRQASEPSATQTLAAAGVDLTSLSRLQRERMLKKAAKGKLRA